jgi:hypothetical protein
MPTDLPTRRKLPTPEPESNPVGLITVSLSLMLIGLVLITVGTSADWSHFASAAPMVLP